MLCSNNYRDREIEELTEQTNTNITNFILKKTPDGRRQDGGRVGGHACPLPQTQQKKPHLLVKHSQRTATNRWQKNLNSNNGKNLVT